MTTNYKLDFSGFVSLMMEMMKEDEKPSERLSSDLRSKIMHLAGFHPIFEIRDMSGIAIDLSDTPNKDEFLLDLDGTPFEVYVEAKGDCIGLQETVITPSFDRDTPDNVDVNDWGQVSNVTRLLEILLEAVEKELGELQVDFEQYP